MKKLVCIIFIALLTTSVFADRRLSKSKKVQQTYINDKFGQETDESKILCACQFNKNRNPGKFKLFNGYLWQCEKYDAYGNCLGTVRTKKVDVQLE